MTRKPALHLLIATALAVLPAFAAPAAARDVATDALDTMPNPKIKPGAADETFSRRINLAIGKSVIIDLPRDAKEVFVADPTVANAVVRTARKIFIIGMKTGSTSVFASDAEGRQIVSLDIAIAKEMTRELNVLRQVMRTALPKADIRIEGVGESIVLSGTVDSPLEVQRAIDIANNLIGQSGGFFGLGSSQGKLINAIQVRGKDQVMLRVTVAEVQRSVLKQLGVNFNGQWQIGNNQIGGAIDNPLSLQRQVLSTTNLFAQFGGGPGTRQFNLRALERQGVLRTLAEPTLTAISGESAKFLAGGEIPVPATESCDTTGGRFVCTVQIRYKPVGVSLDFTPVVLSENRISIRVSTEVTEVDGQNQFQLTQTAVPAFRTRKGETTVELPSGGVLATAGLIQQQSRQQINGLPGLMNLPILGTLFRSRDYERFETELLILVQPVIARPSTPGEIAKPDDGYADATDPSTVFMGRLNRTYTSGGGQGAKPGYRAPVGFITD